jgi:aminopeptidase
VDLCGLKVDLRLFIGVCSKNANGENNMPDGEIYTGPMEDPATGWVRFAYPEVSPGRVVEGVELRFEERRVFSASEQRIKAFLLGMLDTDPGERYLGQFAIGKKYRIERAIKNILFDEKIGGSFHLAIGSSYPDPGGVKKSAIHWDMICDLKQDSEVLVDGELVYSDGSFVFQLILQAVLACFL